MGKLLVLPANVTLYWKVIARYKHSSLFGLVISNEGKIFITLAPGVNIIKLFTAVIKKIVNKLECLSQASLFSLVQCLWVRDSSLPYLSGALLGKAPALIVNPRLAWKSLPGINNLAYYEN